MKTIYILIIASLFIVTSSSVSADTDVSFGIKAGVNFSTIHGDFDESPSMITGFHLGGIVDISLNSNLSIAPELLFTTKGAKSSTTVVTTTPGNIVTDTREDKLKFSYIEVPILVKIKLSSGLHFEAGPYLAFLTSATDESERTHTETGRPDENFFRSVSISSTNGLSSTDFGLAFGLGYQFTSGLGFSARYELGLTDVNDVEYPYDDTFKYTNRTISLSVSYMFGHK